MVNYLRNMAWLPACWIVPLAWVNLVPSPSEGVLSAMGFLWVLGLAFFVGVGVYLSMKAVSFWTEKRKIK
jgi:hypothetical protein